MKAFFLQSRVSWRLIVRHSAQTRQVHGVFQLDDVSYWWHFQKTYTCKDERCFLTPSAPDQLCQGKVKQRLSSEGTRRYCLDLGSFLRKRGQFLNRVDGTLYFFISNVSALLFRYFLICPGQYIFCLLYTSPSPRDRQKSRMPSSA